MANVRGNSGRRFARLRAERGFSQEGFAARAKINRAYMGKIERGEVNISIDNMHKIARSLSLSLGELLSEADKE